jgi:hypothetical protein
MRWCWIALPSLVLAQTALALFPQRALAQAAAVTAASAELVVRVQAPPNSVDAAAVRRAIAQELGTSVVTKATAPGSADVLDIRVSRAPLRVEVVFRAKSGKQVVRSVALPDEPGRATETIALLAGNLVRDEAAELLRALNAASGKPRPETTDANAGGPVPGESANAGGPVPGESANAGSAKPSEFKHAGAKPSEPAKSRNSGAGATRKPDARPKPTAAAQTPKLETSFIDLAFFSPISYPEDARRKRFRIEFGLLYGRIGALEGGGLVVGVSRVQHHVHGAQFAGVINWDEGDVHGAAVAGIGSWIDGDLHGFSSGGILSRVGGTSHGMLLAPVVMTGGLEGVEVGAVSVMGDGRGAQLGVVNVAGNLRGFQAGLLNVGGKINGLQLGLVNVADEVHGAPVGLVSITRSTDYSAIAYSSIQFPVNAAFKMRNDWIFSEVGGGFAFDREVGDANRKANVSRVGGMLGAHVDVGPVFLEPAVGFDSELPLETSTANERLGVVRYRAALGYQVGAALGVLAGAELRQEIPEDTGTSRLGWDAFFGIALF